MHELSIVSALIEQCEELAISNNATSITKVVIKIGVLSGVEPALLKTAFDSFKLDSICANADLTMQIQQLVIKCKDCGATQQISERSVICPNCASYNTEVVDGEDMLLMQLELEKD